MPQEQEPGSAEDDGTRSPFRVASIGDLFSFSLASSRHAPSLHVLNEAAEKDGARGQCNKNRSLIDSMSMRVAAVPHGFSAACLVQTNM